MFADLIRAVCALRPARALGLLAAALAAGLLCDWFRAEERLVFPRPLPEFRVTPPAR